MVAEPEQVEPSNMRHFTDWEALESIDDDLDEKPRDSTYNDDNSASTEKNVNLFSIVIAVTMTIETKYQNFFIVIILRITNLKSKITITVNIEITYIVNLRNSCKFVKGTVGEILYFWCKDFPYFTKKSRNVLSKVNFL